LEIILAEPVWLKRFLPLPSSSPLPKQSGVRERPDRLHVPHLEVLTAAFRTSATVTP
jgi:hypothetical protein